ncbi:MAG TPA: acyl-CoA dehydrogenase family protein [Thermoanaerobaculia bacterium]|nr:acyl-CoA dehydrogenase family protein [Thermoanaerobaculia bacterium]
MVTDASGEVTHQVTNQPPPLGDLDLFECDLALREGLERAGAAWAEGRVRGYALDMGTQRAMSLGREANRHEPELRAFDRFGHRIDEVEFHPAWHELMSLSMAHAVHALPWIEPRSGAQAARSAMHSILSQVEAGHGCPISMTYACVPTLRAEPPVAAEWEPRVHSTEYDPRPLPAADKRSATVGMAMTEKQGGSDVRANTTRARKIGGDEYELMGHKWFCSAPMSDAFLTLAKTREGAPPTCFLVPRRRPDGSRNALHLERLKDKLGNRSNASSEIEYRGAWARRVGPEDRGIPTIVQMVHHTRLDCVSGSTGLMRQALLQAMHHARHRAAFGRRLVEQPLMRRVLADLALESEAATALMLRLAQAFDAGAGETASAGEERAFARLATAVGKYWVCKRAPQMIGEAMECLGGNGYVEEANLARLYREAPVNAIWEGSGNVVCLDVLRALAREPETGEALLAELERAGGSDSRLDREVDGLRRELEAPGDLEAGARRLVERMALALQASLLVRFAPAAIADAFCAARLGEGGRLFGTLPEGSDLEAILERALPA